MGNVYLKYIMNFQLLMVLLFCLLLFYNSDKITGSIENYDLNLLKDWEKKTSHLRMYSPVIYDKTIAMLRRYYRYINGIRCLKWNKIARFKSILPELSTGIVNQFHSILHNLPVYRISEFNEFLDTLHGIVDSISFNTIQDFYLKCPQISDMVLNHEVHLTHDWYIHDYLNPKGYDQSINRHYEFYV